LTLKGAPAAIRKAASQPNETNSRRYLCKRHLLSGGTRS